MPPQIPCHTRMAESVRRGVSGPLCRRPARDRGRYPSQIVTSPGPRNPMPAFAGLYQVPTRYYEDAALSRGSARHVWLLQGRLLFRRQLHSQGHGTQRLLGRGGSPLCSRVLPAMLTAVSARRASTRSGLSGPDSFSFTTDVRRVSPESGTYPYDAQFLRFKTGSMHRPAPSVGMAH